MQFITYEQAQAIGDAEGIQHTLWSVGNDDGYIPPSAIFSKADVVLRYSVDEFWGGRDWSDQRTLTGPVTWMDMWRAIDAMVGESGDQHHIFVEDFEEVESGVYEPWMGS